MAHIGEEHGLGPIGGLGVLLGGLEAVVRGLKVGDVRAHDEESADAAIVITIRKILQEQMADLAGGLLNGALIGRLQTL